MAYRIQVDAGNFQLWRADDSEIDDETTFKNLGDAKAAALAQALPERDAWVWCVQDIRNARKGDAI